MNEFLSQNTQNLEGYWTDPNAEFSDETRPRVVCDLETGKPIIIYPGLHNTEYPIPYIPDGPISIEGDLESPVPLEADMFDAERFFSALSNHGIVPQLLPLLRILRVGKNIPPNFSLSIIDVSSKPVDVGNTELNIRAIEEEVSRFEEMFGGIVASLALLRMGEDLLKEEITRRQFLKHSAYLFLGIFLGTTAAHFFNPTNPRSVDLATSINPTIGFYSLHIRNLILTIKHRHLIESTNAQESAMMVGSAHTFPLIRHFQEKTTSALLEELRNLRFLWEQIIIPESFSSICRIFPFDQNGLTDIITVPSLEDMGSQSF